MPSCSPASHAKGVAPTPAPNCRDCEPQPDDIFWNHLAEDREVTLTPAWATDAVRRYMFEQGEFCEIEHYSTVPAPFVIMQRITVGLTAILGRLNTTANWHRDGSQSLPDIKKNFDEVAELTQQFV
jgi:hypothetical protein